MDLVKRIWYLSPMRAAKVQASLRIHAVSPEPPLLAHTSSESRGPFRLKARSLAPLNGWACAVTICHDEMLEDTNSLDAAHICTLFVYMYIGFLITFELPYDKTNKMACVPSEDSDQPGHQSLLSAWRNLGSLATHWAAKTLIKWSDWADAQADLSLRWAHRLILVFAGRICHFVGFVMRQLIYCLL